MLLIVSVLSPFGLALVAPGLARRLRGAAPWLLAALPAALCLYYLSLLPRAAAGTPATLGARWAPQLGLDLAFRADGLSLLFATLISGVGALVVVYAGGYLKGHPAIHRFYGWLLTFMGAMLGVALADNLILLFVFWELTSFSSFVLIGFEHGREQARGAALQALLVTSSGGLALLAGLVLLGSLAGTFQLSSLVVASATLQASPLYLPALVLVLLGAFTKSAQFPFHFWLPNAMEAPTPVSAYLHSATMVKAGIYLLARLSPALGGTLAWMWLVGAVGLATLLVGGWLSLHQTDLKRLLAYSTVSALGLLTLLVGLGGELALEAAVVFLLAHALYKGALFLVAGAIDHETGTRDVRQLGGLYRVMPPVAVAAALAGLSFGGFPPLFGFVSKELSYEAALAAGPWIAAAVFVGSVFFVFVSAVVALGPFWGPPQPTPKRPHAAPLSLWLPPAVLAGLSLLLGLLPATLAEPLAYPAAAAALGESLHGHLALWHGLTPALWLSLATFAVGGALYAGRGPVRRLLERLAWPWGPAWSYDVGLAGLNAFARWQTRRLQSGYLRYYLMIILLTTVTLAFGTLVALGALHWPTIPLDVRFYELVLAALILLGALVAITSYSRLGAVAGLGAAGYGVALIFLLFGAPDLAMTQFLIESLTVILFVLVFYHLPHFAQISSRATRLRDAVVALAAGALMTTLVLSAAGTTWHPTISDYFVEQSLPAAHGRNIVNVILVDFRGFDTLGEITVLGTAAIGVFALLKLRKKSAP